MREAEIFQGHQLWNLTNEDVLQMKFLYSVLTIVCPSYFAMSSEIKKLIENNNNAQVLEAIFDEMKLFFNERFLDGKSLFRVLLKQTFQNDKNDA
jgi:hypothetical protein